MLLFLFVLSRERFTHSPPSGYLPPLSGPLERSGEPEAPDVDLQSSVQELAVQPKEVQYHSIRVQIKHKYNAVAGGHTGNDNHSLVPYWLI